MFLLLKLIIEVIRYMKLNVFVIDIPVIKELIILGVALGVFTGCVHMFIVYKNHKRLKWCLMYTYKSINSSPFCIQGAI